MTYDQLIADLGNIWLQFKESFLEFAPKLIFAIFILLIGLIVARIFQVLINRLIKNLDGFISSKILRKKVTQIRLEQSTFLVGKVIFWIIFALFLTAATEVLGLRILTTWLGGLVNYLPNILVASVIVFLGIFGGKFLRDFISNTSVSTGLLYADVLGRIIHYVVIIITVLIAVDQIGIDIDILTGLIDIALAAILFGAALAFGLGARTSISNILAAYYLQSSYKEGQLVKIGQVEGRIIQITSTAVILDTGEGQISVPAKMFSEEISTLVKREGQK